MIVLLIVKLRDYIGSEILATLERISIKMSAAHSTTQKMQRVFLS